MDRAASSPRTGIESKRNLLVKALRKFLIRSLFFFLFVPLQVYAFPVDRKFTISDTDTFPLPVRDKDLPNIEAKTYEIRTLKRSSTNRSYLFEDPSNTKPVVGRIILLKKDEQLVMAFRVLRTFPVEHQFIARRVRKYAAITQLEDNDTFTAIERVTEVGLPGSYSYSYDDQKDIDELSVGVPGIGSEGRPTADFFNSQDVPPQLKKEFEERRAGQNKNDLSQLDEPSGADENRTPGAQPLPETQEFDPELDTGTSPTPRGHPEEETEGEGLTRSSKSSSWDDESDAVSSIEEVEALDSNHHALSGQYAYIHQTSADGGSIYFSSVGLRYGWTLGRALLLNRPKLQDSFTLEGGVFIYKVGGYAADDDSYTVLPIVLTARYSIMTSDTFGFFLYGGLVQNRVTASSYPEKPTNAVLTQTEAVNRLSTTAAAAGGGLLFRFGPGWEARADIGIDMIAMGLMLRF